MSPGCDPDHFVALFAVEDRHFWFAARNLALKAVIEQIAPSLPASYRVLEIGCGTGNTLRVLKEACPSAALIVGVDLLEEGLVYARQRRKLPLVRARIENAPFTVPFEVVGMFDVPEHIEDDVATLCVVRALTAPRGRLLVTVPAHKALWSRFDEESHHCRRYEPDELRERLTDAGFDIDYLTPFMARLYPLARVSRWWADRANDLRRRIGVESKSAVMNDLAVRPVLNDIMAFMLRLEAPKVRRREQLHMGTSLLVVARVT